MHRVNCLHKSKYWNPSMNKPVELIIFDWDGTLFDSVGQIVASLLFAAQRLFPQVPELHTEILQCYAEHYVANSKGDVWFDGVADMLNGLRERGLQLAVATGKSRKGLDRVLAQTQSQALFVTTRAASETKSKPHPLMLEEILAETGVSAESAIMVGDTSYDLEMARNIAMPRIGVSYGVHTPETLRQYQPLAIADDVPSLQQHLLQYVDLKQVI